MVEISEAAIVDTTKVVRHEGTQSFPGTLELTIKKAELKGEPLPAYT